MDLIPEVYYRIPNYMDYMLIYIYGAYNVVSLKYFKKYPLGYFLKPEGPYQGLETKYRLVEDSGKYKLLTVTEIMDIIMKEEVFTYRVPPRIHRRRKYVTPSSTYEEGVILKENSSKRRYMPNFSSMVQKKDKS